MKIAIATSQKAFTTGKGTRAERTAVAMISNASCLASVICPICKGWRAPVLHLFFFFWVNPVLHV